MICYFRCLTKKLLISTLFIFLLQVIAHAAKPVANFTSNKTQGCSPLNSVVFTSTSTGSPTTYFWDFGNGNTSTLPSPSASFINNTSNTLVYTVKLTVSNASGSDSITKINYITVFAKPTADFTANKLGGCSPDTICFTDLSVKGTGVITHWSWDFGDGNSSTKKNPCNYYTANDTFKVTLVVTDTNGCTDNITKNKYVTIAPCQVVKFNDTAIGTGGTGGNWGAGVTKVNGNWISCHPPLTLNYTDATTPANSGYTYLWDFGDGSTSTQKNPSHTYTTTGYFSVTETVTSPTSSVKSLTKKNHIYIPDIQANFNLTGTTSGCAPLAIFPTNQTTPDTSIVTYQWSAIPSGPSSILKNPNLLFNNPGTYDIKLRATILGCSDTIIKTAVVTVYPKPTPSFTPLFQKSCTIPFTASFTDASTNAVSWFWNFGDGTTSTSSNPSKTYANFGRYKVKLVVTSAQGCKDSVTITNEIQIEPSGYTTNINPTSGCKPLHVSFGANDTSVVPLTVWQWKLNGTTISTNQNDTVTIQDTGIYILTSTGTNADGCTLSHVDTIKVTLPPIPNFTIDKHTACFRDATFIFTNLTNNNNPKATRFVWTFGDGKTGNQGGTFSYTYTDTGTFIIKLIAYNLGCASQPFYDTVRVNPPIANFTPPSVNCSNDTLQFTDGSIGGNKWLWNFGNGDISTLKNPKYQYPLDGTYKIILTVYDTISGCSDTASTTIFIPASPVVKFSLSDTAICPGGKITFTDQSIPDPTYPFNRWTYNFSDGQSSTFKNTTITFTTSGFYTARLTVKDTRGCVYSYKKDSAFYVFKINAKFGVFPDKGCAPLLVIVADSSTSQFPIKTRKWLWGTGDSTTTDSVTINTSYIYLKLPANQNSGYNLTLKILDSMGCTATSIKVVKPSMPLPNFTSTIIKRCGYDSVRFAANKATTAGLLPFTFKWDFANGQSSVADTAVQKYFGDSIYSIKLIMKDGNGCIDSISKPLAIHAKRPVIGFKGNPLKIDCPGPPVYFFDTSIAGGSKITAWLWDFGDGTKSTLTNPARTYINPGVYDLSLKITDSLGCTDYLKKPGYVIIGGPVGTYFFSPKTGCTPLNVHFFSTSPNAKKFEWDLGDGNIDTLKNDSHIYKRDGIFIPNLTLTDSNGCKIGLPPKDTIVIYPLPNPDFIANTYAICKGGTVTFSDRTTSPNHIPIKSFKWSFGTGDSALYPGPICGPVFYQYLFADTFTVSLTVTDTLGCTNTKTKRDTLTVTDDTIPPRIPTIYRATVLNNSNVLMEFTKNYEHDWAKYTIYYNYAGALLPQSNLIKTNINDTTFTETNLNTLTTVYSYLVSATDVCNNESQLSVKNTTVNVETTPMINAINVHWTAYFGWDSVLRYEIYRQDSLPTNPYHFIKSVSGDSLSFIDTNTVCYKPFFYKIKAVQNGGLKQFSWSDTSGAVPIYQPTMPPTQNVRATVVNDQYVLLQWRSRKHKLPFTFIVYRITDDGAPLFYKEFAQTDTFLVDMDVQVDDHSYTYITYLKDNCGGLSEPSNISKTILLKADLEQNDILKYDPVVGWSRYSFWNSGIDHYKVEFFYDSSGGFYTLGNKDSNEFTLSHKYVNLEQREYCYRVTAYQVDSQSIFSESNIACISTAPRLFAPDVFTINGDNLNDVFQLGGVFLDTYHISIYNRWGELMFESDSIHNSWDGTYKGTPCTPDVYVFLAEATGRKGQRITIKGNVTLLR